MCPIEQLLGFLSDHPAGPIGPTDESARSTVERLLAAGWDQLEGGNHEGMQASKLNGRTEDLEWEPPTALTFVIERHGGYVKGSKSAELHRWQVDLKAKTAQLSISGRRRKRPFAPALNVPAIAGVLADKIANGQEDPCLRWSDEQRTRVRVLCRDAVRTNNGEAEATLGSRVKRLVKELCCLLTPQEWHFERRGSHSFFFRD